MTNPKYRCQEAMITVIRDGGVWEWSRYLYISWMLNRVLWFSDLSLGEGKVEFYMEALDHGRRRIRALQIDSGYWPIGPCLRWILEWSLSFKLHWEIYISEGTHSKDDFKKETNEKEWVSVAMESPNLWEIKEQWVFYQINNYFKCNQTVIVTLHLFKLFVKCKGFMFNTTWFVLQSI